LHAQAAHKQRLKQARTIALFFARIYVVVLLWYPAFGLMVIPFRSPMPTAIGLPIVFLQSAVLACMSLTKTDVREAVVDLLSPGLPHMCRRPSSVAAWQSQPQAQHAGFKPATLPSTCQLGSSAPGNI
jgi:acyl-CoA synthetase (AMP-forming)/AMP-acid ligase II